MKKTRRIYNELGLQLRNKHPKRRVKAKLREDRQEAAGPNEVWAMGKTLRILTVVDTHSRLCAAADPRFAYRGEDVMQILERVCAKVGYRTAGADEVVVKNGGHEIFWSHLGQSGSVRNLPVVNPVDTTGAGDSFNGVYLSARPRGQPAEASIVQGHAMASRVVLHRGALIAQDTLREQGS